MRDSIVVLRLVFLSTLFLGCAACLQSAASAQGGKDSSGAYGLPDLSDKVSIHDLDVPESAHQQFEKGRKLLLHQHKSRDSITFFAKAIEIAPSYSQAYFLLGVAEMDLANWSEAQTSFENTVRFNDKLAAAYLGLGSCLVEQKKFSESEEPLLRGLQSHVEFPRGHYDLGRAYYGMRRFREAEEQAQQAVALAPGFPNAHALLGLVLDQLGESSGAVAEFETYLRLASDGSLASQIDRRLSQLKSVATGTP